MQMHEFIKQCLMDPVNLQEFLIDDFFMFLLLLMQMRKFIKQYLMDPVNLQEFLTDDSFSKVIFK